MPSLHTQPGEELQMALNAFYDMAGGNTKDELGLEFQSLGFTENDASLALYRISVDLCQREFYYDADQALELIEGIRLKRAGLKEHLGLPY